MEIYDKNLADEIQSKKDKGVKVPCLMPIRVKLLTKSKRLKFLKLFKASFQSYSRIVETIIEVATFNKGWISNWIVDFVDQSPFQSSIIFAFSFKVEFSLNLGFFIPSNLDSKM